MTTTVSSSAKPQPQIDKAALLAKYKAERDKRLRPDGNAQYLSLKGRFAHHLDDPYTPVMRTPAASARATHSRPRPLNSAWTP